MRVIILRSRAIDPSVIKVAESLLQHGHKVKLLVWDRENTLKIRNDEKYVISSFSLKAPYDKISVLFYLPIWWIYEFFYLLKEDCDVIHACDLDTLIPAIIIKTIKRNKLYYMIYDFYADNLPKRIPRVVRNSVAALEKIGIRFADVLFLADKSRYEQVKGAEIKDIVYIYNSPPDYFDAKQRESSDTRMETDIFYAGLIHKSRGLEYIIRAVELLDDVNLVVAGIGPNKNLFGNLSIDTIKKKKIQYIGWIPYEDVIKKTFEADILFAFYDPTIPNNRYASPNKLFEAMMCGKPIIVNDGTSMANIVKEEKCGLVVPYGDVDAIKKAVIKLRNTTSLKQKLGENGRRAYEMKYSWKTMESRLLNAYNQ